VKVVFGDRKPGAKVPASTPQTPEQIDPGGVPAETKDPGGVPAGTKDPGGVPAGTKQDDPAGSPG
jgi:hypothetical protein